MLLSLLVSVTGCARSYPVVIEVPPVRCEHPVVDPRTAQGLVEGLTRYYHTVELCNALNGHSEGFTEGVAEGVPEGVPEG